MNVVLFKQNVEFYDDRVRVVVTLDSSNRVQSFALNILNRSSIFDRTVQLTEQSWAITLISSPDGTGPGARNSGHAMITYEGIARGAQFLRYLHLRKDSLVGITGSAEIHTGFVEGASNGPTCRRPRDAIVGPTKTGIERLATNIRNEEP